MRETSRNSVLISYFFGADMIPLGVSCANAFRDLGYDVGSMRDLNIIEHGFTHYRLTIQPVLCELKRLPSRAESPGRLWIDIEEAGASATPAPVKKLLQTFARGVS